MNRAWHRVDRRALLVLHDESLAEHGGAAGCATRGLLESALAHPFDLAADGASDIHALAAAHGVGLAKDHPFVDGNKRTAFLAVRLTSTPADATLAMLAVAAGQMGKTAFAHWLRQHTRSRREHSPC